MTNLQAKYLMTNLQSFPLIIAEKALDKKVYQYIKYYLLNFNTKAEQM